MLNHLKYRLMAGSAGVLLLLGGVSATIIHAQTTPPAPTATVTSQAEDPSTGPDQDNVQDAVGDQSGSQVEDGVPDTGQQPETTGNDPQENTGAPDTGSTEVQD